MAFRLWITTLGFGLLVSQSLYANETEILRKENVQLQQQIEELKKQLLIKELEAKKYRTLAEKLQQSINSLVKTGKELPVNPEKPEEKKSTIRGSVLATGTTGLIEISIGADAGLTVGKVLEVYRLSQENPKDSVYLGQVSIERVIDKRAVGRFKPQSKEMKIRIGDEVSTSIQK